MNEFTFLADAWRNSPNPDLIELAVRLAATPCSPLYERHVSPDRELSALLEQIGAGEDGRRAGDHRDLP